MNRLLIACLLALTIGLVAFAYRTSETPNLPDTPYNYANQVLPEHFNANRIQGSDNTPLDNAITDAGATLGRVLFYDKRLSLDETVACASCHVQAFGFSDPDSVSVGVLGRTGTRNSMGLSNARFYGPGRFLWGHAAATLEEQVLMPISTEHEMGTSVEEVIPRLEATTFYPDLFQEAFGSSEITADAMAKALAQFVRSVMSYRSRFDEGRALVVHPAMDFPNFTESENRGKRLFFDTRPDSGGQCSRCHLTDIMIVGRPFNNGLDSVTVDPGLGEVTGRESDMGKFKSTSLRDIGLTAPYMHDGRFATLEEVLEFYNSGVQPHPNLSPFLLNNQGNPRKFFFTADDRRDVVAFLHTLTDDSLKTDLRWSNPFEPLELEIVVIEDTVTAGGGTVAADIMTTNTGFGPHTFTLKVQETRPDSTVRIFPDRIFTVEKGETNTLSWSQQLPGGAPTGTYTVDVTVEASTAVVLLQQTFTYEKLDPLAAAQASASASEIPASFEVFPAFPNPFDRTLTLRFHVPDATDVTIDVLDLRGRHITTLSDGARTAGTHEVRWEPRSLAAGLYLLNVRTGNGKLDTQQVTLVR